MILSTSSTTYVLDHKNSYIILLLFSNNIMVESSNKKYKQDKELMPFMISFQTSKIEEELKINCNGALDYIWLQINKQED